MTQAKELLAQIAAASKVLNQAADAASDAISSIEKKLLDAEPGTTVWHQTLLEEETTFAREEGADEVPAQRRVTLGFAKVKGKWGIAVREEILGKKKARDTEFTDVLSSEVSLLRKADRDLRIVAMPAINSLLEAILEAVKARTLRLYPNEEPVEDVPAAEPTAVELATTNEIVITS